MKNFYALRENYIPTRVRKIRFSKLFKESTMRDATWKLGAPCSYMHHAWSVPNKQSSVMIESFFFVEIVTAVFHRFTPSIGRARIRRSEISLVCSRRWLGLRVAIYDKSPVKTESLVPVYEPCINSRGAYVRCVLGVGRFKISSAAPMHEYTSIHTSPRARVWWVCVSSKIVMEREEDDRLMRASDDDA